MKIAMVVDGLQIGGIERVCADYSKILLELGHNLTIINLDPSKKEMIDKFPADVNFINWKYYRKYSSERYTKLIKYKSYGKFIYPGIAVFLDMVTLVNKLAFKLRNREQYDLVIAFSSHFNDLTFVANNFVKSNKKLAWLHGALYSYLLISDGYYNLYNKIKNLICLVDDAQDEVIILNKNDTLNINKLYNPTYMSYKKGNGSKIKSIKEKYGKFLLMVSRFSYPHKDHYTVIDAFAKSSRTHSDINLVLVGDGPDEENVKKYVRDKYSELKDKIYFLGAVSDVENYYQSAYMLVHASVAGEGLPTVQIEALANNLPQVVTDSKVGPREILGNNKYGLLTKVKDSKDMSDSINLLLDDENLYKHYQMVSKERVKDFTPEVIKEKLNIILKDVMEK